LLRSEHQAVRRTLQVYILLASVILCPTFANAQDEQNEPVESVDEQRRIREIRIDIAPIYTEEEAEESSWARFTKDHHIQTRESVIRTQLLFKEGEVLDEELLEASERSLRRFKFLNKVDVLVVPVDDQSVDVEVKVQDAWSLEPGMNIKGGGDLYSISAHLIEFNLLGSGKKLYAEAIYESDVGTTTKFGYSDPQLFNSRWVGSASYTSGPLIDSFRMQARLPLYSPDSKWSYGASAYKSDSIIRLFDEGEEVSRFAKNQSVVSGFMKRSFGPRYQKTKLNLSINYKEADFSTLGTETTTPPPQDQANLTPSIGLSTEDVKWMEHSYINKMGPTEDNWVGLRYGGKVGYGIPLEDGFELWNVTTFITNNLSLAHQQLLYLSAAVSSEVVRNTVVGLNARYYKNFSKHTVSTRFRSNLGYELDTSRQFTLGADSGLRGYPARAFSGDKLVLINLEDRQYWGKVSLGAEFALGTIVFVDAGNVWKRDEEIDMSNLNWSTGFGLRLGMSNLPHQPIVRIDLGWALTEDNFALTVGAEQQF
jgi:hemolysin activation/secretion protein